MESGTLKTSEHKAATVPGQVLSLVPQKGHTRNSRKGSWTLTVGLKIRPRTCTTSEAALRRDSISTRHKWPQEQTLVCLSFCV